VPESGPLGSVRGAPSNGCPYRDFGPERLIGIRAQYSLIFAGTVPDSIICIPAALYDLRRSTVNAQEEIIIKRFIDVGRFASLASLFVRAPMSLEVQVAYVIQVVRKSLRTDVTDSDAMEVDLTQRMIYTIAVKVNGSGRGRVISDPPGIECGTPPAGPLMTTCTHDFGIALVSLFPLPANKATTKFIRWSGNCAPNDKQCYIPITGVLAMNAEATFGDINSAPSESTCPAAPPLPGLRWAGIPDCASGNIAGHPSITHPAVCDGAGYSVANQAHRTSAHRAAVARARSSPFPMAGSNPRK
jgi:hypothetical protein